MAHDRAGNMIKCPKPGTWVANYDLKYDAWNRLVEVKEGTTVLATYAYEGLNRRVKTTSGGTARHFYYSAAWQVLEERLGTSPDMAAADRQFVWGLRYVDDLVLRNQYLSSSNEVLFAVQDANFNVAATVDDGATPAVVERFVYSPYGAVQIRTANFANPISSSEWEYRYAGYRFDTQTGLMQVRNRYLHPQLGRWVTRDPIPYSDSANVYMFVNCSPATLLDPLGLATVGHNRLVRRWDYSLPEGYTWDQYHGQKKCTFEDCCEDLEKKIQDWITNGVIRQKELLVDYNDLRKTDPTSYNNHIRQLHNTNRHIIECWII